MEDKRRADTHDCLPEQPLLIPQSNSILLHIPERDGIGGIAILMVAVWQYLVTRDEAIASPESGRSGGLWSKLWDLVSKSKGSTMPTEDFPMDSIGNTQTGLKRESAKCLFLTLDF